MARIFSEDTTVPTTQGADGTSTRLVFLGTGDPTYLPLTERGSFTLGRSPEADIPLKEPSLSRLHARLTWTGEGRALIRDLGSSNGTFVRGRRLGREEEQGFAVGEVVGLGDCTLLIQRGPPAAATRPGAAAVVVQDPAMRELFELARRLAPRDIHLLILGETGVGKEVMAQTIHAASPRRDAPFVALNCGAFGGDALIDSELFGHEAGAFTGAIRTKPGLLEAAGKGTLFLDEVGEMPPATQVKLLRVLEERQFRRLGGVLPIPFEARLLSATNRDLERAAREGAFRQDLFYRLNGFSLLIPPLRARPSEIAALAERFAAELNPGQRFSPAALEALARHPWPGNVRELKNVVVRAVVLAAGAAVDLPHLALGPGGGSGPPLPDPSARLQGRLEDVERAEIVAALDRCGGNQTRAAKELGVSRKTLLRRLDQYGLPRPRQRPDEE